MDVFLPIITEFGFPVACVIALAVFVLKFYKDSTEQNTNRENKLMDELAECRAVNQMAIETIGSYATKLEVIQHDVAEIKSDIDILVGNHN